MHTILYIEDNLYNTRLIERLLSHRPDVQLLTATSGEIGFNLAKERQPDLIMLDVHLPDVLGFDVFTRLRSDTCTSSIPVVVLSADATPEQRQRFLSAGVDDYLTKPLDLSLLLNVIDRCLSNVSPSSKRPSDE